MLSSPPLQFANAIEIAASIPHRWLVVGARMRDECSRNGALGALCRRPVLNLTCTSSDFSVVVVQSIGSMRLYTLFPPGSSNEEKAPASIWRPLVSC